MLSLLQHVPAAFYQVGSVGAVSRRAEGAQSPKKTSRAHKSGPTQGSVGEVAWLVSCSSVASSVRSQPGSPADIHEDQLPPPDDLDAVEREAREQVSRAIDWSNYDVDSPTTKAGLLELAKNFRNWVGFEGGDPLDFGAVAFGLIKEDLVKTCREQELRQYSKVEFGISRGDFQRNWTGYFKSIRRKVESLEFGIGTPLPMSNITLVSQKLLCDISVGFEKPADRCIL